MNAAISDRSRRSDDAPAKLRKMRITTASILFLSTPSARRRARASAWGAPGPQNLSSPVDTNQGLKVENMDSCVGGTLVNNLHRNQTPDMAHQSTFGYIQVYRKH